MTPLEIMHEIDRMLREALNDAQAVSDLAVVFGHCEERLRAVKQYRENARPADSHGVRKSGAGS